MVGSKQHWLVPLRECDDTVRKTIFQKGPITPLLLIFELCLNWVRGNYLLKGSSKVTEAQRQYITTLSKKSVSVERKRKFLTKKEGLKLVRLLLGGRDGEQNAIGF